MYETGIIKFVQEAKIDDLIGVAPENKPDSSFSNRAKVVSFQFHIGFIPLLLDTKLLQFNVKTRLLIRNR